MNTLHRIAEIDLTRADSKARTAPAVLSTEYPVERSGYVEVLEHSASAVDLGRAPLPLIVQHDARKLNIGVVENLRVVGKKLRGVVRLGSSALAKELWSDIADGVVRSLSIGYEILTHRRDGERLIATSWRPYEVSLVSVPADPGAGLFRSRGNDMSDENTAENTGDDSSTPAMDRLSRRQRREQNSAVQQERARVLGIQQVFDHFQLNGPQHRQLCAELINTGADLQEARDYVRTLRPDPVPSAPAWEPTTSVRQLSRVTVSNRGILRAFSENPREAEELAYASGQWIRAALFGNTQARAWLAQRGMNTIEGSKGGVLVPAELSSAIISLANDYGVARMHARVWPMSSDSLAIPRRKSGVTGYYVAERNQITESDMTTDMVQLVARKYAARVLMSTELSEDSVIDVVALLADEMAREFARAEDEALFNGDATSTYGGMTGARTALAGLAGAVAAGADNDTFGEVSDTDLGNVAAKLPSYARKGAAWFVSPEFDDLVFQRLAMAAGGTTMTEIGNKRVPMYRGYPIVHTEVMPGAADAGDDVIVALFGDMKQAAAFGDRRSISVRTDDVSRMQWDQIVVQATERFDIVVHDVGDATTAGPLVGLKLTTS